MATQRATSSNAGVVVSLAVNCLEVLGLGLTAWFTGSTAIKAQTAANTGEVAVTVFLLIGVLSSARGPDDTHPLGYGRDRFFWSLFAALGLFVGGGGLALGQAVQSALHPAPVHSFLLAYLVLGATAALDASAMIVGLRPLREQAVRRGISSRAYLRISTDPAAVTVVVGGGCAVVGAFVAAIGLAVSEVTISPLPDTVASGLIGLLLLSASVLLLRTNRELLTGRGVGPALLSEMRKVIAQQPGVSDVPDLFAVVVGPLSLVVDGDVTFDHGIDVSEVEASIASATSELRERWPMVQYIYLTPVATKRPRGAARVAKSSAGSIPQ
jgi:cation diffusion facilitator family transporter